MAYDPNITTDAQGNAAVVGGIVAGNPAGDPLFTFTGTVTILDVSDPGAPLLEIDQVAESSTVHGNQSAIRVVRGFQATMHTTAPIIYIESDDSSSTAAVIEYLGPSIGQGFKVGIEGGIGTHGHAPQTAPRTLAQSVITAITDANAQTAVQALANALSDMGALTLT